MCCDPFAKRQPCQFLQRAAEKGQSKRSETIRFGTSMVTPPSASIRSLKSVKLTTTTWLIGSPVRSCTVRIASAGPPDCIAALIFAVPTPGIETTMSRGIERYASRWFFGSLRTSMIESE